MILLPRRSASQSAQLWLCDGVRRAILDGRLQPGERLPATRQFARDYRLARGTIVAAFEQLQAEGYVHGRRGSGTYVSDALPDDLLQAGTTTSARRRAPAGRRPAVRRLSRFAARLTPFPQTRSRVVTAFRANEPAVDLFPLSLWAQIAGRRLRAASASMLQGCEPLGYLPLRSAIADYLRTSRGVACQASQVAVVSGSQEALDLMARLTLDEGDRVCIENPGYIGATHICAALGARVVSMPVDDEGMRVDDARLRGARLVYVTPAHQFPSGVTLSLARRMALLERARREGALIYEDDYDSEYRYAGRPMPAMQGLDRHGSVVFCGTFSKVMAPALRLGYLVVPDDLVDRVAAAKSITTRHAPVLEQATMCEFLTAGHFGRHLRRMRQIYAERLGVLLEESAAQLGGLLEVDAVEAGLQTVGWLRAPMDAEQAAALAAERRIEAIPISRFTRGRSRREGLLLGFAAVDTREIRRGVRDLAAALTRRR